MKLSCAIQLSLGIVLFHDNARPHTADLNVRLLNLFNWEVFEQLPPPHSPDLAPSDFHLFLHLKSFLGGKRYKTRNEIKKDEFGKLVFFLFRLR